MSTKKDKFSSIDKNFMKLALKIARVRKGLTGSNPSVGCLIVKDNRIISIGQTGYNGRPHAEYNAIENSNETLLGSKMYVTLEPCSHYGKTPPCTKKIIKSGINEIIYSMNDIDKRVKGKSFKILSKCKIKVKRGLLKDEAKKLYDSYIKNRLKKLPFVTAKIAISKNKIIYTKGIKRITNKYSDKLSHYLRYKNDAIMISSKTLNIDNPKLDCRLVGYEKYSPKRIILDKNLNINFKSKIIKSVKKDNTILFYNSSNTKKINLLKKKGICLIKSKLNQEKNFDLKQILRKLFLLGINNLLVEGGDKITKNLIKSELVDLFFLFKSPKILPRNKVFKNFTSIEILNRKYKKKNKIVYKNNKDNITIYRK